MRRYSKEFTINLNLVTDNGIIAVSTRGSLYPVASSEQSSGRSASSFCPTHGAKNPVRIKQHYYCPENPSHGPFSPDECLKGKEVDGQVIAVDAEIVKEAKESDLLKDALDVSCFDHTDLMGKVYPTGNGYFYLPDHCDDSYKILCSAVWHSPDLVLAGKVNLRGTEKLVALMPYSNGIVVQQLTYPEHLNQVVMPDYQIADEIAGAVGALLDSEVQVFDPVLFADTTKERLESKLREVAASSGPVRKAAPKKQAPSGLMDLLTQSVAAQKASPRKRAPKKAS